jgi:general secretion pathway protein I
MRRNRQDGFTLLEVLVAFAIVAIALAALIEGAGFGLSAVSQAGRYEEALSRARSHLAAVGPNVDRLVGEHTDDDGGGFRWALDVRPFTTGDRSTSPTGQTTMLYAVTVTISWRDGKRSRDVTLVSERLSSQP